MFSQLRPTSDVAAILPSESLQTACANDQFELIPENNVSEQQA